MHLDSASMFESDGDPCWRVARWLTPMQQEALLRKSRRNCAAPGLRPSSRVARPRVSLRRTASISRGSSGPSGSCTEDLRDDRAVRLEQERIGFGCVSAVLGRLDRHAWMHRRRGVSAPRPPAPLDLLRFLIAVPFPSRGAFTAAEAGPPSPGTTGGRTLVAPLGSSTFGGRALPDGWRVKYRA